VKNIDKLKKDLFNLDFKKWILKLQIQQKLVKQRKQ
jgi:ribosomal protein L29